MTPTMTELRSYQQRHANRRARERLDIKFNRHIAHELILQIKARALRPVQEGPGPGAWFKTELEGKVAWFFYSRETDRIVTILDYEPWQVYEPRRRREKEAAGRGLEPAIDEERARMFRRQMKLTRWIFNKRLDMEIE